ncbi:MAG: dihydroxy-acid dehydratase [bacterium]
MNKNPLDTIRKYPALLHASIRGLRAASRAYDFYLKRFKMKPKSSTLFTADNVLTGMVRRGILHGLGIPEKELLEKPLIGIANSWSEFNPGHAHLHELAKAVKKGVIAAGGVPFEFNVPAPCDGMGNGNLGMRFILPQRDLIADIVEMYMRSQWLDGMVTISSCDKINPGMLMAAARLDLPAICLPGGPNMQKIRFEPGAPSVNYRDYDELSRKLAAGSSATCGACELVTTANTIQCLMEALGMALPGAACAPAFSAEKYRLARETGARAVALVARNLTPSKIMTRRALENAVMVHLAIGGSTNSALHLPAIARELGLDFPLQLFNEFNRAVPTLCGIAPNGPFGVTDLHRAGGVPAVMKTLGDKLHGDCLTVAGASIAETAAAARVRDPNVIRPLDDPFFPEGGTAVLSGSLAPDGAVVKQSAVAPHMMKFEGRAVVFDGEEQALKALQDGKVKQDSVMVIRYEGPVGGPGMPELLTVTALMDFLKLDRVALVTDGRFSGATSGPCVGHVSPEAADGGPIAAVRDGDAIEIDIPERRITLKVADAEVGERLEKWKPLRRGVPRGCLARYRESVSSAARGAVLL